MDGTLPDLFQQSSVFEVIGGYAHVALDGLCVVSGVVVGFGLLKALIRSHFGVHSGVFAHYLLKEVWSMLTSNSLSLLKVFNIGVHFNGELGFTCINEASFSFNEFTLVDESLCLVDED